MPNPHALSILDPNDTRTVTVPLRTALLVDNGFLPLNPNRCRTADKDVVQAAKDFQRAINAVLR